MRMHRRMPTISVFYGIVISMYFKEHAPPHFHAKYAEHEAAFTIKTLEMLRGKLPARARSLVLEWADLYRKELLANWEKARNSLPLDSVPPLC